MEEKRKEAITCVVEGQLKSTAEVDFGKVKLAVHAFIKGVEVARVPVDEKGGYKLTFKYRGRPPATELRVIPAKFSPRGSRIRTLSKTLSSRRYILKRKSTEAYYAYYDLFLPALYFDRVIAITKTYRMHGLSGSTTPISLSRSQGLGSSFMRSTYHYWSSLASGN